MKYRFLLIIILFFFSYESHSSSITPPISPAWILGHIVWEDNLNTQDGVMQLVDGYLDRDIPVQGVIIDSPWSTSYNDFNWDLTRYPHPEQMTNELRGRNVKPIIWMTGAINKESLDAPVSCCETYEYVVEHNFAVNNNKTIKWWKGTGVHIDFTNEEAIQWWYKQLDKVFNGFYGFKVDAVEGLLGEPVHTSIGDLSNREFRSYYYDAMYDYVKSRKPDTGIIYARPYNHWWGNYASINKFSIGWCGDYSGSYDGLIMQIKDILQSAINGYCAVGCEIGGFNGDVPTANTLIRYAQFASMTACMINGGANGSFTGHIPWWHGEKCEAIYKYYVTLHNALLPYIFSEIVDCHIEGGTLLKECSIEDLSHFMGNAIFTKAIVTDDDVDINLPIGDDYYDFYTEQIFEGGSYVKFINDIEKYPIFIRAGSVIPFNIDNDILGFGDKSMKEKKVISIYPKPLIDKIEKVIHWPKGDGVEYDDVFILFNQDKSIKLQSLTDNDYVVLIHNIDFNVENVKGAKSWSYNKKNKMLEILAEGKDVSLKIESVNTGICSTSNRDCSDNKKQIYKISGIQNSSSKSKEIIVTQCRGKFVKRINK